MLKYYKHIDFLPMFNYVYVNKTGDLRWLLKLENYDELPEINQDLTDELSKLWDEYQFQIIDVFGLSDVEEITLERQKELTILVNEYMITDDKSLVGFIKKKQKELKTLKANKVETDIEEQVGHIEKFMTFQIDLEKTSVSRYLNYVKIMKKKNDATD